MSKKTMIFLWKRNRGQRLRMNFWDVTLNHMFRKFYILINPLIYIDCFAGKGKFDDGNPGSPLIALDIMNQCIASTTMDGQLKIGAAFIDLNYWPVIWR